MEKRERPPFWLWMNLLSLDAPVVAVVWQDFLARCYPTMLRPAGRWVLGLTVWAIYLADRLLDARHPLLIDARHPVLTDDTPRHRFYRQNFGLAWGMLGVALIADILISGLWLRHVVFANGLVVGGAVIAYLGVFPVGKIEGPWKAPAAAVLFTTGVFLVAWTGTPGPEWKLVWPAATFAGMCLANLMLIGSWERGGSTRQAGIPLALVAILCVLNGDSRWYCAVAVGFASLAALAVWGRSISSDARRVLADAVLLGPLLFVWW